MKTSLRGGDDRGVYAVYWEKERTETGIDHSVVLPSKKDTPEQVKLMILDSLLTDLQIPISIDDYKLKRIIE